jgi:UDP-N-acetylmuramoyl-tripeptide--D-alanyl-D-alanine ligase
VTNIGEAHVEGFGGMESIIRAKCELYFCVRGNGGTIFVNGEDALLSRMCKGGARVVYGGKKGVVRGESLGEFPFLACDLVVGEERFRARTRLVGEYNLNNVVAAVAVGMHFGVPPAEAARAIEGYEPSNRSQWLESEWNTIMLDAYNANPSSMKAAVSHFAGMPGENKLLVLGEMLEMGHRSADAHRELLELVESLGLRHAYAVGAAFEGLEGRFPFVRRFGTTGELAEFLREHPVRRSLVLVKGSRGNQLERVIEYL